MGTLPAMSRTLMALSVVAALAFAGCSYKPPVIKPPSVAADGQADTMAPPPMVADDADGDGKVSQGEARQAAQADFRQTVKVGTGWAAGLFTLASVGLFALSFFIPTIPRKTALTGVGIVAGVWVARYMLLAYGTLAADIVAWCLIGLIVVCAVGGIWTVALWWKNRNTVAAGKQLAAEGKPREATALLAAGNDRVNANRAKVAATLAQLDSMTKEDRAKALAKLKEWGVKL